MHTVFYYISSESDATMLIKNASSDDKKCMDRARLASNNPLGIKVGGAYITTNDDKFVGAGCDSMPLYKKDYFKLSDFNCHAEMNAIVRSNRTDFTDCKMYVTRMPCNTCAKLIIQKDIKKVIYLPSESNVTTEDMFRRLERQGFELILMNETDQQVEVKT